MKPHNLIAEAFHLCNRMTNKNNSFTFSFEFIHFS